MKCYYHNQIDAVATCRECGKHLCKECYDNGQKGTCAECLVDKQRDAMSKDKKFHFDFIKKSLICLIAGAIIGLIIAASMSATPDKQEPNVIVNFRMLNFIVVPGMLGYIAFSLYWGLNVFSKVMKKILALGVFFIYKLPTLIVILFIAILIGVFVGLPMFVYHLVKFIGARAREKVTLVKV